MYIASIKSPIDRSVIVHQARTSADLNIIVDNEIKHLVQQTYNAINKSCLVVAVILLFSVVLLKISLLTLLFLAVAIRAYLTLAPLRFNPIAEALFAWRCKNAWVREYDRINAADAKILSR